jgi:hypothetical protein
MRRRELLRALALALAFVPAFACGWLVARHAVNVPVQDDWERASLAAAFAEGTLGFGHLYEPHIDHRMVFPRLFFLTNLALSRGDLRLEMAFSFALALAGALAVAVLLSRTLAAPVAPAVFLANLLLFSPLQWENFLWAIQSAFFLSLACVPLALLALSSSFGPRARFGLCLAAAIVSTHSFGSGILLWLVVPAYVLLEPGGRHKPAFMAAWAAAGALVLVPYFSVGDFHTAAIHNYGRPPSETAPALSGAARMLADPDAAFGFMLAMLGSPLSRTRLLPALELAPWAGGALLLLFAAAALAAWRRGRLRPALPWLALGGTGVAGCALTAVGRSALIFPDYALVPHYVSVSTQLAVALVALGALLLPRPAAALAAGLLAATQATAWLEGAEGMHVWKQARLHARTALVYIEHFESRVPGRLDIDPAAARSAAELLDRHGFLDPPLARAPDLSPFAIGRGPAARGPVRVERVRVRGGRLQVRGRGESHGVLLSFREGRRMPRVLALGEGFTPVRRPAHGWEHVFDFVAEDGSRRDGQWDADIPLAALPPNRSFHIEVWAVDAEAMRVERVRQRIVVRRRARGLDVKLEPTR